MSLVVVVPVFSLLAFILVRYREGNTKSKYSPDWDNSQFFEGLWWGVPCLIIIVLAVVTWTSTHQLDPYRTLDSKNKPINVQVVALQWKWLFIYPDLGIASVNELEFPVNTPINFELTADAPMNSFWIPSLGGQIYAMPGMVTQLHLIADTSGNYAGSSANISGDGFAGMKFTAKARTASQYQSWVSSVRASSLSLNDPMYNQIAKPSSYVKPSTYVLGSSTLYDKIVAKYMMPSSSMSGSDSMNMMEQN